MLAGCHSGPTFSQTAKGLESDNPDVRRESALRLSGYEITDPELREAVVQRLSIMAEADAEPLVRSAALVGLCRQDAAEGVKVATRLRTDPSPLVRIDIAKLLGRYDGKGALDALLTMRKDEANPRVRTAVVESLGKFRDFRAAEALVRSLGDADLAVKHAAWQALRKRSGKNFPPDVKAWQGWLDAQKPPAKAGAVTPPG